MLSEISQTEKDKYHMISLICGIEQTNKKPELTDTENRLDWWLPEVGAGVECGEWMKVVNGTNF